MRIGVVGNPRSGNGRAIRSLPDVVLEIRRAGHEPVELDGSSRDACIRSLRSRAAELDALLLLGGDGLTGVVINVPEARDVPIGLIPLGSGNDLARQFDIPVNQPVAAARYAMSNLDDPQAIDLCRVTGPGVDRLFAGALSFGFDAAVNRRANDLPAWQGRYRYQIGLVQEVFTYRARQFRVTLNGAEHDFRGMLATVTNTRSIGGGIRLMPDASVRDGVLELVTVDELPRLKFLRLLPTLLTGAHIRRPEVRVTRVTEVTLESEGAEAFADGDEVGMTGPFTVTVQPGAVRLLVAG